MDSTSQKRSPSGTTTTVANPPAPFSPMLPPPPPTLTASQARNLLNALTGHSTKGASGGEARVGSHNQPSGSTVIPERTTAPSLQGRPVLIPFSRVAFLEGELQPERIKAVATSASASTDEVDDDNKVTVEQVHVAVGNNDSNNYNNSDDVPRNTIPMSLTEAIRWSEQLIPDKSLEQKEPTQESNASDKSAPSSNVRAKRDVIPKAGDRRKSKNVGSNTISAAESSSPAPAQPTFTLVDIHEEYSADGQQVYGKVVDLSTRLRALWKENGESKTDDDGILESIEVDKGNGRDDLDDDSVDRQHQHQQQGVGVSDDEYERLSRRLEELARLEEEQQNAGTTTRPTTGKGPSQGRKPSSLKFKKGFLNTTPNKKAPQQAPSGNRTASSRTEVIPTQPTAASVVGTTMEVDRPSGHDENKDRRITIDTTRNTVQQIPRVGRQQPVPSKQQKAVTQQHDRPMLDPLVFSGHIQERPQAIDADVAMTDAPNNQPPDGGAKKKRVSRFAQERMQQR